MSFVVTNKNLTPVSVTFKVPDGFKEEPVLFIWEDSVSKNVKHADSLNLNSNVEYFSTLNKSIDFFENGLTFKVVKTKTHETVFQTDLKNLRFIPGKNVLYISQNGYTGYSYAARNYIYQLLTNGYNVQWDTRFTKNNVFVPKTSDEKMVAQCINNTVKYDSVIVHHTPEVWNTTLKSINTNAFTFGLTVWETTRLSADWTRNINASSVNQVIVPSKFNINVFKDSGVTKKLNLWYHDIFPFVKTDLNLNDLFEKFEVFKNKTFVKNANNIKDIIKNNTVYYNISQYSTRKNIDQVLHTFCSKFSNNDNVCLFIKSNIENFDDVDKNVLKYKFYEILKNYDNHPNIVFCFDKLNDDEINTIHEFGDVYFTLNRGEGFGLCTYTAKKMGNKIICGLFGAEKEFLDDNDVLLDYRLDNTYYLDTFNKNYIDDLQRCAYFDTDYIISKLKYFPKTIKNKYNYV